MFFVKLGFAIIVIRVLAQVLFGAAIGETTLFALPSLTLPEWMAGVRLGGPVTLESILMAFYDGLRLATIIICIGAANSLASPSRLLKSVPAALYEIGVSVVVALTFTPKLVADVSRVQAARHLRGRVTRGPRAIAGAAMPVLEGALEGSITLAAAMDSRGYGRRNSMSLKAQRATSTLLVVGLIAACIGTYGLVAATAPMLLSAPMLILGVGVSVFAITRSAQSAVRTRYRPDPWWLSEWLVAISGIFITGAFIISMWMSPLAMETQVDPAVWPALPLLPLIGLICAVTPALTAPPIPHTFVESPQITPQPYEVAA
jgi:energy-coupling factor transport system permease protein